MKFKLYQIKLCPVKLKQPRVVCYIHANGGEEGIRINRKICRSGHELEGAKGTSGRRKASTKGPLFDWENRCVECDCPSAAHMYINYDFVDTAKMVPVVGRKFEEMVNDVDRITTFMAEASVFFSSYSEYEAPNPYDAFMGFLIRHTKKKHDDGVVVVNGLKRLRKEFLKKVKEIETKIREGCRGVRRSETMVYMIRNLYTLDVIGPILTDLVCWGDMTLPSIEERPSAPSPSPKGTRTFWNQTLKAGSENGAKSTISRTALS